MVLLCVEMECLGFIRTEASLVIVSFCGGFCSGFSLRRWFFRGIVFNLFVAVTFFECAVIVREYLYRVGFG